MRLDRSVQSGPLEIRTATLLRKSASDRHPSGCPAKTFKMVTWKPRIGAVSFFADRPSRTAMVRESPWDQDSGRKSYRCRSLFRVVVIAYWMRIISAPSRVKT
jgi:hypothetical protein